MGDDGSRSQSKKEPPQREHLKIKHKNRKNILDELRKEWKLFWETLLPDENKTLIDLDAAQVALLSREEIKTCIKSLSLKKNEIHRELEKIQKEIELNQAKRESLSLVGGDFESVDERLNVLSELGSSLSEQLEVLNHRLKLMRQRDDSLKRQELNLI